MKATLAAVNGLPDDVPTHKPVDMESKDIDQDSVFETPRLVEVKKELLDLLRSGKAVTVKAHDNEPERTYMMNNGLIQELTVVNVVKHSESKAIARRLKQLQRLK